MASLKLFFPVPSLGLEKSEREIRERKSKREVSFSSPAADPSHGDVPWSLGKALLPGFPLRKAVGFLPRKDLINPRHLNTS